MYQGGVAILVHEDLQLHIKQIERVGRRILKITLATENATAPINILETYAPHTGYTVEAKNNTGIQRKKLYSEWIPRNYVFGARAQTGIRGIWIESIRG